MYNTLTTSATVPFKPSVYTALELHWDICSLIDLAQMWVYSNATHGTACMQLSHTHRICTYMSVMRMLSLCVHDLYCEKPLAATCYKDLHTQCPHSIQPTYLSQTETAQVDVILQHRQTTCVLENPRDWMLTLNCSQQHTYVEWSRMKLRMTCSKIPLTSSLSWAFIPTCALKLVQS